MRYLRISAIILGLIGLFAAGGITGWSLKESGSRSVEASSKQQTSAWESSVVDSGKVHTMIWRNPGTGEAFMLSNSLYTNTWVLGTPDGETKKAPLFAQDGTILPPPESWQKEVPKGVPVIFSKSGGANVSN